jgi:hypothetical protein
MNIKKFAPLALVGVLIFAKGIQGFAEIPTGSDFSQDRQQDAVAPAHPESGASIPKGNIFALLAVGIIGIICIRRKKKAAKNAVRSPMPQPPQPTPAGRKQAFIDLNKQYLNLQYKITRTKFTGDRPSTALRNEISDIERKVRLISRALE